MSKILKSNSHAQEAGAKIIMIKKLLSKIKFDIEIKLLKGPENQIGLCSRNPLKYLLKECDTKIRKI